MDYETITYSVEADVALLTLHRPERMNALNGAMRREITSAVARGAQEARVVVLTGAGRCFCSGQDLSEGAEADLDVQRVLAEEYEPMLRAIVDCPVPTMAAVNGPAAGAGASLALAVDVAIASEAAEFAQAYTGIGLIPDAGATYLLPRQVGMARALGATLFGDRIGARQARDWGMVYETVPEGAFDAHWRARAAHLAKGPTEAYRHLKTALRASAENGFDAQLALEAELQGRCGSTRDFHEGVHAFLEKRPPAFEGR